jgi:hypothetical protein
MDPNRSRDVDRFAKRGKAADKKEQQSVSKRLETKLRDSAAVRAQMESARQHRKDARDTQDEEKSSSSSRQLPGDSRQAQHREFESDQEVRQSEDPNSAVTVCPVYDSSLPPSHSEDKTSTATHRPGETAIVGSNLPEEKSIGT